MNVANPGLDVTIDVPETSIESTHEHSLPSGRHVVVRVTESGEELQVRSPEGEVEVCITLTDLGPVVRLRAARLELEAADTVALRCRRFEVKTDESTHFDSAGDFQVTGQEMHVRTTGDIHLNGGIIRLNC